MTWHQDTTDFLSAAKSATGYTPDQGYARYFDPAVYGPYLNQGAQWDLIPASATPEQRAAIMAMQHDGLFGSVGGYDAEANNQLRQEQINRILAGQPMRNGFADQGAEGPASVLYMSPMLRRLGLFTDQNGGQGINADDYAAAMGYGGGSYFPRGAWTPNDTWGSIGDAAAAVGGALGGGALEGYLAAGGAAGAGAEAGTGAGAAGAAGETAAGAGSTAGVVGADGLPAVGGTAAHAGATAGGVTSAGTGVASNYAAGTAANSLLGSFGEYGPYVSAALQALGSYYGSRQQADGINRAIDFQRDMYQTTRGDLAPYRGAGYAALPGLLRLSGAGPEGYAGIQSALESLPGYRFTRDQGLKAVQNSAAARGLGTSGAALKGAARFSTGLADSTFGDQWNRLMGLTTLGENAAAQTGAFGTQTAEHVGNNLVNLGAANAAGTMGIANAGAGAANTAYMQWLIQKYPQLFGGGGIYAGGP